LIDPNRRSGLVADDGLTLTKGRETPKYWGSILLGGSRDLEERNTCIRCGFAPFDEVIGNQQIGKSCLIVIMHPDATLIKVKSGIRVRLFLKLKS